MSSTTPHERSALLHFPASNSNTIEESIEDVNINKTHTFRNLFFTILLFIGVTLVLISPYSNIFQTKFLVYNTTDEQNTTVNNYKIDENNQNFPINFVWGVATSSYQIEGGVNEGGRGETIWDVFVQQPNTILDNSTGSIADDNYHQWKNDIALIKSLNIKAYRFSIAWSRILPLGIFDESMENGGINYEGIQFYNNIIDELIQQNIQPWITMFHWDLPQWLQDNYNDGWLDRRTIDAFGNYARIVYTHFGDRVKHFITVNEPWTYAVNGHSTGIHAPGRNQNPGVEPYIVAHNLLLAHAKAYRIYQNEFFEQCKGMVGIANSGDFRYPKRQDYQPDKDAAERSMLFQFGWFVDPILKSGDYPDAMRQVLGTRLPTFSEEEKKDLIESTDFLGLNYYSSLLASESKQEASYVGYWADLHVDFSDANWVKNDMDWNVVPGGLHDMLLWISERYGNPLIYITENGTAEKEETLESARYDTKRLHYIEQHLIAASNAIVKGGVNLRGYFAWSFMDNFEWQFGYQRRFGICRVDFDTLERTPKSSAYWYRDTIQNNGANLIIL